MGGVERFGQGGEGVKIDKIRLGHATSRYHNCHRLRTETVGHHSAGVAALCLYLRPNCSAALLTRAIMHDVPEGYTGDVPAPVKWDHEGIADGLAEVETAVIREWAIPHPHLTAEEETVLKLADMLDLVMSCIEEVRMGNTYAGRVVQAGLTYIAEMDLPGPLLDRAQKAIAEVRSAEG